MSNVRGFLKEYGIALGLIALTVPMMPFSGISAGYITQELIIRLGRNAILVLALLPMLHAGMGFNFALGAGAMAGQIGLVLAVAFNLVGLYGLAFAVLAGIPIAVFVGWISGLILNRMKGLEMVISYCLVPFLFEGFYLLLMLYLMGSVIPLPNPDLLLKRGYGIRNTVEYERMRQALDHLLTVHIGPFSLPIGTYLVVAAVALFILWLLRTKLGQDIRAVGSDPQAAEEAGISVNRTRLLAVLLSMVLACLGQVVFLQNMGNMATYNAHGQTAYFAVPALMVGGVALRKIRVRHALIGIPVLHAFFILAPGGFMRFFGSAQAGEYARIFVPYALVALGLVRYGMEKCREAERKKVKQETCFNSDRIS